MINVSIGRKNAPDNYELLNSQCRLKNTYKHLKISYKLKKILNQLIVRYHLHVSSFLNLLKSNPDIPKPNIAIIHPITIK